MTQKNLLLICADMMAASHMGCYGNAVNVTPNLDQLAADGIRFDNAYCATTPCIPARISMMSGQYAHTHGKLAHMKMTLEPRPPLLPEILSENGYQTAIVGKTHFYPSADDLGFQQAYLTIDNHLTAELGHNDAYMQFLEREGLFTYNADTWAEDREQILPDNLSDHALKVNWTGDTACNLLESLSDNDDAPFFLYVSFVEPHGAGSVKQELWDEFADKDLPDIIPVGDKVPDTQRRAVDDWDTSNTDKLRYRSGVYASISLMDANVGKILAQLDELGLRDSTNIIFLTDHGELMYDHGCIEKTFLYEPAVHIPWLMAGADIPKDEARSGFVSQIDLLPTVLDLCGIESHPKNIDGHSLLSIVSDADVTWRASVFCEVEQSVHLRDLVKSSIAKMVRWQEWKYIYTLVDGAVVEDELYHLVDDPDEQHNLANYPDYQLLTSKCRTEILNWLMRTEVNRLRPVPENHYPVPKVSDHVFF